jgi:protein-disulfide isomerase
MENNPMDVERWVDEQIGSLGQMNALPDAAGMMVRLQGRERRRRVMVRRLRWGIAVSLAGVGLAAAGTLGYLHQNMKPVLEVRHPAAPAVAAESQPVIAQPTPLPAVAPSVKPAKTAPPAPAFKPPVWNVNFREAGSPTAPVGCEIYTDYECPPCAAFYRDTVPLLIAQYVDTGKVRLLRRDFPLPFHPHAQLAARYADAAGLVGEFQVAADRILQTQSDWHQDGDIERQLSTVLPPEKMAQLHEVMKDTRRLDELIAHDRALAADDHVDQTPTVILEANGKRRRVTGVVSFPVLRNAIDEMLAQPQ